MKSQSHRLIILAICIFVIIAGGIGFFFLRSRSTGQQTKNTVPVKAFIFPSATVYLQNAPPTPGSEQTTYTDTTYGYSLTYPKAWVLTNSLQHNIQVTQLHYQVNVGDVYPFQITCQSNPTSIDAQTWFTQHNLYDKGLGYTTLGKGLNTYLSIGHGQASWKSYTVVHAQIACEMTLFLADDAINQISDNIANSFTWK